MPSRVVHVLSRLDRGGTESVALDLVRQVDSSEVEQHFVCIGGGEGILADRFREAGAVIHMIPLRTVPRFVVRLKTLLRMVAADVVVSHVSLASVLPLAVARWAGVPNRSARFHSAGDGRADLGARRVYRALARCVLPLVATDVTGVSQAALEFGVGSTGLLARRWSNVDVPCDVVPNGVDTDVFRPPASMPEPCPLRVLHVGRAAPEKNRQALVALARVLSDRGFFEVRSVGSASTGDLTPPLPANLKLVALSDSVPDEMRQAHALVLPSLREGLPGVVLEALSSGVPVVASDLPTLRELSARLPGITLVDPQAPAEDWADACIAAGLVDGQGRATLRADLLNSEYTLRHSAALWSRRWAK